MPFIVNRVMPDLAGAPEPCAILMPFSMQYVLLRNDHKILRSFRHERHGSKHTIRHEAMRIGGEKVTTKDVVEVLYPYTDEVIGTVPAGTAEHAARAFEIAANYKPKLTRYERQQILFRAAELIRERREEIAHWLTLELGICKQHSLYETGPFV